MTTPNKVLQIAAGELGYNMWTDPARNKGIPGSKYGRDYRDLFGVSWAGGDNVAYCNIFTTWCLHRAGVKEPAPGYFAYTVYCYQQYKNAGREIKPRDAQPGDLVFFDWEPGTGIDHVGFCELNLGDRGLQCIEGNTSGTWQGSQSNGGGVYRRVRPWPYIRAVVRPFYSRKTDPVKQIVKQKDEEEMIRGFYYPAGRNYYIYVLFNPVSGWYSKFSNGAGRGKMSGDYVNPIARNWETGSWPLITKSHAEAIMRDLDAVRKGR